jgi:hypothetical protein
VKRSELGKIRRDLKCPAAIIESIERSIREMALDDHHGGSRDHTRVAAGADALPTAVGLQSNPSR